MGGSSWRSFFFWVALLSLPIIVVESKDKDNSSIVRSAQDNDPVGNATAFSPGDSMMGFEEWLALHKPTSKQRPHQDHLGEEDSHLGDNYNYSYSTREKFLARQQIYQNNLLRWKRLNQIPGGARYGPETEPHADLTPEEFAIISGSCGRSDGSRRIQTNKRNDNRRGSLLPNHNPRLQQQREESLVRHRTQTLELSTTSDDDHHHSLAAPFTIMDIDWRKHAPPQGSDIMSPISYVTPVKNQGPHGTCWSFGAAENLEGLAVRQGHSLQNISEQEFISCCSECRGASADHTFLWLLNKTGGVPALEDSYPYDGNTSVPCFAETAPRADVELHSWGRVQDQDGTGDAIVAALNLYGPMGLGVDAKCFHGYQSGVVRECDTNVRSKTSGSINHAVLMVASGTDLYYSSNSEDNNREEIATATTETTPKTKRDLLRFPTSVDFFVIKNSWGSRWGEDGYVRIERGKEWWGKLNVIYTE